MRFFLAHIIFSFSKQRAFVTYNARVQHKQKKNPIFDLNKKKAIISNSFVVKKH